MIESITDDTFDPAAVQKSISDIRNHAGENYPRAAHELWLAGYCNPGVRHHPDLVKRLIEVAAEDLKTNCDDMRFWSPNELAQLRQKLPIILERGIQGFDADGKEITLREHPRLPNRTLKLEPVAVRL